MDPESESDVVNSLSARGRHFYNNPNLVQMYTGSIKENIFHPTNNPQGIVNMGLAESTLCEDILLERLNQPDCTVFTSDMLYYFEYDGDISFKQAVCDFFCKYFKPRQALDANNVSFTSGAGAAMEMIANCVADAGDYLLTFAPCYAGLMSDFYAKPHVKLISVDIPHDVFGRDIDTNDVRDIVNKMEDTMTTAISEGKNVKGVVVVNPHNPTGRVMPPSLIKAVLDFGNRHDIHIIMNEIYAMTVFDESATFSSVLQLEAIPNKSKTHLVWGFSKDFNLAGVRCGVLYTWNEGIKACAPQMLYYGSVPTAMQHTLKSLISDSEWLDTFFTTNHRRMRKAHDFSARMLDEMGVPYVKPQAAYFLWANLSKYLSENTKEGEFRLFQDLIQAGVYFFPGQFQACEDPGWFRITFVLSEDYLEEGLKRLAQFLRGKK